MTDKEKALVEKVSSLPPALQDKFLDRAEGAILALEFVKDKADEAEEETA